MTIKRILIIAPVVLILFLLQSYFWVPTYEQQTRGNPERLREYITASIGDADVLNPILSADSASSQIESLVFEGLIDRDEELRFRGRLATSWKVFEEAYLYTNASAAVPGLDKATAEAIVALIKQARSEEKMDQELKATVENIREIAVIPPRDLTLSRDLPIGGKAKKRIIIRVQAPARIKLTLKKVDQGLFQNLKKILGDRYFDSFPSEQYLSIEPLVDAKTLRAYAGELLPPTEHNPVIIFHLRPNVKFHDGHVFDARDVKFTYEAIMDPRNLSPRTADYEPVKRVEVIDPLTVRIIYKRLYSPAIATWAMGILPEHLLNREALEKEALMRGKDPKKFNMRRSNFNRRPLGCGPFVFRQWKSDQYISLKRFDAYWEGPPNYSSYEFRVIPDMLTQEMEFYAGTIDSYGVQPHQVKRLKNDPKYQSFSGTSFGYTYIGYNLRRKPFDDPRVRRALSMAIDVNKIIKYVLYGQGERMTGPFVKQTDYYNHHIQDVPYDPAGALKLLKEAGWKRNRDGWLEKNGKRLAFTLITNSGNDQRKDILVIAQNAWKQIGVHVETDLLEWAVFIRERVNKFDFDALVLGWSMGIEPDLYQIWHSSQTNPHQLNFVGFKNKDADDLIIRIRQEYDHTRQVDYCHRLHQIIAREQAYTFLFVRNWTAILDKKIVIKEVDDNGTVRYKKITPTKTGNYTFYFNKWIKLPEVHSLEAEG